MKLSIAIITVLLGCGGKEASTSSEGTKPKVLARLATFATAGEETYDKVKKMNDLRDSANKANQEPPSWTKAAYELPPSPADTLASDVRLLAFYDFAKPELDPKTVTAEAVGQVLVFYTKADPKDLRGLRPATHQAFVKSLADAERSVLADELVEHIKENGFKGADRIEGAPPAQPSATAQLVLAGGAAAVAAAPPPTAATVPTYAGKYKTSEGAMTLYQHAAHPDQVDGVYAKGQIACNATGDQLDCAWMERGGSGHARFTRDASGNLKGTWGNGTAFAGGGPWTCTLLTAGVVD